MEIKRVGELNHIICTDHEIGVLQSITDVDSLSMTDSHYKEAEKLSRQLWNTVDDITDGKLPPKLNIIGFPLIELAKIKTNVFAVWLELMAISDGISLLNYGYPIDKNDLLQIYSSIGSIERQINEIGAVINNRAMGLLKELEER